jgi:hypothetical protein
MSLRNRNLPISLVSYHLTAEVRQIRVNACHKEILFISDTTNVIIKVSD